MKALSENALRFARVLIAVLFVLNAIGIIDQAIPAKEMMGGVPAALVPWCMFAGRPLELVAGFALVLGVFPRLAALALLSFLIPATLTSHSFCGRTSGWTGR
jgi:putative oxidoreductase